MNASRRALSAATLVAAIVAVVVMAVWGVNAATSPIEDTSPKTSSSGPTCAAEDQIIFLRTSDLTVSVYNTGKRKGRARVAQEQLEALGYSAGAIGNGEDGDRVPGVEIRRTEDQSAESAQLVAAAFGPNTPITVTDEDYGPGVDVFIGDKFKKVRKNAPKRIKLPADRIRCR